MPFGDYKNTDYMFNPSCQYFTIKYNGRIVAQSVVIDGRNRQDNSDVVILDNIEVANNYKNLSPLLARVYQIFWAEYTSRPVKVGTGYSDLIPSGGKLEQNIYEPKTYVQYSDASGEQIYDLPKIQGVESLDEIVTFAKSYRKRRGIHRKIGDGDLSARDGSRQSTYCRYFAQTARIRGARSRVELCHQVRQRSSWLSVGSPRRI